MDCLAFAHENGCPWDETTCANAASEGHLNCLVYAHENNCPWDRTTCHAAAEYGNLDCLIYAHKNGCPWDKITCILAEEMVTMTVCVVHVKTAVHMGMTWMSLTDNFCKLIYHLKKFVDCQNVHTKTA